MRGLNWAKWMAAGMVSLIIIGCMSEAPDGLSGADGASKVAGTSQSSVEAPIEGETLGGVGACCYGDGSCEILTKRECETPCPGDMDCDGKITFNDIDPFVEALTYPGGVGWTYACPWLQGDIDGDGTVTFNDIDGFVDLLSSGATCSRSIVGVYLGDDTTCASCGNGNGNGNDNGAGNGNDNGAGNGNDNGAGNGNDNGAGNGNDNGAGNGNDNGAGNGNDNGAGNGNDNGAGNGNDNGAGNGNDNGAGNGNDNGAGNGNDNGAGNGNDNGAGNGNDNGAGNGNDNGAGNGNDNGAGNGNDNGAGNGNDNGAGNGNDNGAGNGNDNGAGNGNDNGAGNGNDNGAGNGNDNGAGNGNDNGIGNGNDNSGNGNGNDNGGGGDRCPDGSIQVYAPLSGSGTGDMEYREFDSGCRRFRAKVDGLNANTTYDVKINGVVVGKITTDKKGKGELRYEGSGFPSGFPTILPGDTGAVGSVLTGTFGQDCSENGNCNG